MMVIKIALGMMFGLAAIFCLLQFLLMFFVLALRGVYLSETAGVLLALLIAATLTKWTFKSAFRKKMSQQFPRVPGEVDMTTGTASTIAQQASHPTVWLVGSILLSGLCLGGIGAAYGAYLHFHPEYKEKLIHRTLSLPHPDNYEYLASAQAIRYMDFGEIVGRKAIVPGLFGGLIAGIVGLTIVKSRYTTGVERSRLARFLLMGLAVLLAAALLFQAGSGSGMVYYHGHNQFYWCEQLESKNEMQRRQATQAACSLLEGKPFVCRLRMSTALANCGEDAKAAIPALKALLHDENEAIRRVAAEALKKIDKKNN